MGVRIEGEFKGDQRVSIVHESGDEIITVPPKDNRGDGSKFSPTDLSIASMASCMLTIMSFVAVDNGIDFKGVKFKAEKIMQPSPRMIKEIRITFQMPSGLDGVMRKKLEKGAHSCPVKRSFHPDVNININFSYRDRL